MTRTGVLPAKWIFTTQGQCFLNVGMSVTCNLADETCFQNIKP